MADYLADVYPIPVEWNDGQAPTARFLNAWAAQIDNAFALISRVLGDFDGAGEAYETYVANVIRSFGAMGWINTRLPRNLRVTDNNGAGPNEDLPRISETLSNWNDLKEALLTFCPEASEATDGDSLITVGFDGSGEFASATTKVGAGDTKYTNLSASGRWIMDGRRIVTHDPISSVSRLVYAVDTGSDDYRDAYGPDNGANVVPSMYEITSTLSDLCTISQPEGYAANKYRIDFPGVRRVQNPLFPQATDESNTIQLENGAADVHWEGEIPKYPIPDWIYNLAVGNAGVIPDGLIALWHQAGAGAGAISRVRSTLTADLITWELIPGTKSAVSITLNGALALPANGSPEDEGEVGYTGNRYIVAFAGTSVADALVHERSRMLLHKHDGHGDESLINTEYLAGRFNPERYTHSRLNKYNWFPQYLERGGYDSDEGSNRNNAMMGTLHMAQFQANPTNNNPAQSLDSASHSITFGHTSQGPKIRFVNTDIGGVAAEDLAGKLQIDGKAVRSVTNHFFGDQAHSSFLTSESVAGYETLVHNSDRVSLVETRFETGVLNLRGGLITCDDFGGVGYTGSLSLSGAAGAETWTASTNGTRSAVSASEFEARLTTGDTFNVYLGLHEVQIVEGVIANAFDSVAAGTYTNALPRIEAAGFGQDLEVVVPVKYPQTVGLSYPGASIALAGVNVWFSAESAPATGNVIDPDSSALRYMKHDPGDLENIASSPPDIHEIHSAASPFTLGPQGGAGHDYREIETEVNFVQPYDAMSPEEMRWIAIGINGSLATKFGIIQVMLKYRVL